MNDRTITRASKQGTHTLPTEGKPARNRYRTEGPFTPALMEIALASAREQRIADDIAAYAIRKGAA